MGYRAWLPGHTFPRSALEQPLQCRPASEQARMRVVPYGVSGVVPVTATSQEQGAREAQSGRIAPRSTGSQIRPPSRRRVTNVALRVEKQ